MEIYRRKKNFFAQVKRVLGASQVIPESSETLDSSGFKRGCGGLILVRNETEVVHVVRCAHQWSVPLDPVATGHNAGFGDSLPQQADAVILALSPMNRVLQYSPCGGWMRIQPGVSQARIVQYLLRRQAEFEFEMTSYFGESSVLGNALERGRTLFSEREHELIGARVVLPSGQVIHTGFNPGAKSPLGAGLNLHPLIFQSNLGVVVEGVIRLRPKAARKHHLLIGLHSFAAFTQVVFADQFVTPNLRPCKWLCWSSFKSAPYLPWRTAMTQRQEFAGVLIAEIDPRFTISWWRRFLAEPLNGKGTILGLSGELLTPQGKVPEPPAASAFFSFSIQRSKPALKELDHFCREMARRLPLEFKTSLSFLAGGAIVVHLKAISRPGQDAASCGRQFRQILQALEAKGYAIYRGHSALPDWQQSDLELKRKIKNCFDPRGVIAPGRYGM